MNNTMIHNWNSVVQPTDTVYHVGDFIMGGDIDAILRRLNGLILFCEGNHDKSLKSYTHLQPGSLASVREINVDGQRIFLSHYAHRVWNKSHHGSWHLYGHSHGTLPDDPNALSCDVGVDCWNFFPVSMEQLRRTMKAKTWKPIDHHGDRTV